MIVAFFKVQRTGISKQATAPKKRGRRGKMFVEIIEPSKIFKVQRTGI